MSEFDSIEEELKFMADCSDDRGDSETSLMFVRYLAHIRKLNAELAALKEAQGEAITEVSAETFSSDGTSDIITCNLPIGTKLYLSAPPASADAASVPRGALEFPAADDHEKAIGWEYSYEFISQVERLAASRTEFTTSMEAVQETLKAACELRALLVRSQEVKL